MPERFPSRPGMAFPVFHVLADAAEWSSGMVLPVAATDPLRAVALAVSTDAMTHVVVGNVTPEAQRVLLRGLPDGTARVRVLDEASAETALVDPSAWRAAPGALAIVQDGRIWLELGPFAVARVDAQA